MEKQLEMLREDLGVCDDKILSALLERNALVEKIMKYKEEHDLPILQPEQEAKQMESLKRKTSNDKYQKEIISVFSSITKNSKRIQARHLFDYNIFLIGFMGTGKTTISDYFSNMFAMKYFEMDEVIAQRAGMSISDIFATYGEQYFRDLETNLIKEVADKKNTMISCGGGTPMRQCNVDEMKKSGKIVLLTATPETVFDRVKDSHDRPVIENNKNVPFISDLMEQRRPKYEAAADIVIHTDNKTALEICEEIVQKLKEN
jgi:shikimate kinase